jgi:prolyl-tRNA editing enzyme YbaK/EbsC (Cys-tRNA(Pro) deacylase)
MWPESVERIAAFLRTSGVEGRLEELPAGTDSAPGAELRAEGFDTGTQPLVALVPAKRRIDADKLMKVALVARLREATVPPFPFEHARVLVERSAFAEPIVWLHVGSGRYVLGLAPQEVARLTRGETADLLLGD